MKWENESLQNGVRFSFGEKQFTVGPDRVVVDGLFLESTMEGMECLPDGTLAWRCRFDSVLMEHTAHPSTEGHLVLVSTLRNLSGKDLHIGNVEIFGALEAGNGCGWNRAFVSAQTMLGDEGIIVGDRELTSYGYYGMTAADGGSSALFGFLDFRDAFYQLVGNRGADGSAFHLSLRCLLEGIRFVTGRSMTLSPLVILADGQGLSHQLQEYAHLVAGRMGTRVAMQKEIKTGWCSWYTYYGREGEEEILRNVRQLVESPLKEKIRVIQLDDGWNLPANGHPNVWGDWMPGSKFPRGMKAVVDDIHAAGFEAGLWLAPFTASADSRLYQDHPDWFVGSTEGSILMLPEFGLDLSHPEVLDFIRKTFERVFDAWGFDYIKIDFILYGAIEGKRFDDTITSAQAYRKGMEVIRGVAGDRFILACGAPVLQSAGLVDGMRLGADVGARWALPINLHDWPYGNCAVMPAAVSALYRDFYNGILWQNDPDCIVVRDYGSEGERRMFGKTFIGHEMSEADYGLSFNEAAFWTETLRMTGGMLLLSEVWEELPEDRKSLVMRCFERLAGRVRMVDQYAAAEVVILQEDGVNGEIGFFNMAEEEVAIVLPLARLAAGLQGIGKERLSGNTENVRVPARSAVVRYSQSLLPDIRAAIRAHTAVSRVHSAHEHIGSLTSFGHSPGPWFPSDVQPALRPTRTTLLELLFTPYASSQLFAMGASYPPPEAFCREDAFLRTMQALRPALSAAAGIGVLAAIDRGLKHLYGIGLQEALADAEPTRLLALNLAITERYEDYFRWYAEVMRRTGTLRILKPVHPDYLLRMSEGQGAEELDFAVPIARVESLVGFYDDALILDFSGVERVAGFSITDADSLERMIAWFFSLCDRYDIRSLKQLQAYSRNLAIGEVSRDVMAESLSTLLAARGAGGLGKYREEAIRVQDYTLRKILEEADQRGMPYQFHTGMTTLSDSNPGLLEPVIRRYRNVRFVLLHAYPFISEAAYLARNNPNVWVDTSWQALQSPDILRKALHEYIGMVPASRITASIDATCLEEYAGGLSITRDVLCEVLADKAERGFLSVKDAFDMSDRILGRNTFDLYRL